MLQPIVMKENGKSVLLLVRPEEGDNLEIKDLNVLVPIIQNLVKQEQNFIANVDSISIINNELIFNSINDKDVIEKIIRICHNKITEKLIVTQQSDVGPSIRHRVMFFGPGSQDNSIVINYTTLGDFNSIDSAINQLKSYQY